MKKLAAKWQSMNLIWKILGGVVIGAILGVAFPRAVVFGYPGTLFIGALKAIAPILVFVLVMSSISKAGKGIGAKFRNVIILYLVSTLIAAFIAVGVHFLFPLTVKLGEGTAQASSARSLGEIFEELLKSIVENPISAMAGGNYLGILFWAIIIGLALKAIANQAVISAVESFSDTISKVVAWVIQCAPLGVLGIVYSMVATSGLAIFSDYGLLILELVGAMLFVMLVSNPLIIFLCTRSNPYPLVFTCIRKSAISAFFTRSSAANIPVNMALCEELGLDKDFYSVSIPLGSTINMDGAAVTITIMSLTLARTLGVNVSFPTTLMLVLVSTLAACGTSGVAGGSLLLIPMACSVLGIPNNTAMQMVAVGFVISVIQDSVETALNSSADVAFTATAERMVKLRKAKQAEK